MKVSERCFTLILLSTLKETPVSNMNFAGFEFFVSK